MPPSRSRLATATVLVGLSAFAGCTTVSSPVVTPAGERNTARPAPPDVERLEAIYRARQDSARLRVHEADVRFMTGMIHHHAQALVMSRLAPKNGASPSIRTLTARIINAQSDEIAVMQRWLRERGRPAPAVDREGHVSPDGGHMMHMTGMLSQEQLDELAEARGARYDRLFLTYMIQHHEGAVDMVHELFATDGAAQGDFVFKLASDIQVDQNTEVARMQRMLDRLPNR